MCVLYVYINYYIHRMELLESTARIRRVHYYYHILCICWRELRVHKHIVDPKSQFKWLHAHTVSSRLRFEFLNNFFCSFGFRPAQGTCSKTSFTVWCICTYYIMFHVHDYCIIPDGIEINALYMVNGPTNATMIRRTFVIDCEIWKPTKL